MAMSGGMLLRTFPCIVQALPHSSRLNITSTRMGRLHHPDYAQERTVTGEAEAGARMTSAEKRKPSSSLRLRTLDFQNLSPEDFVVLSGRMTPLTIKSYSRLVYSSAYTNHFPDGTQEFFYWHTEPGAPAFAGQVRFRVTNSKDPASF
ncbi:hypothetical protein NEOLEDRAFT_1135066 [Neolentinus lepideus HHB14362 ss-1]|uniref:Uncharacterized protein n=1 Tax=Neolentinus lepideus HHB14362 ss-1 TaxID=1314782 RepID=A0A165RUV2_9AGAM|nr:hypothetical protein NEOLEDRAFT_1135066 [Neolentinus lepideus HHB14362 ss-1]